MTTPKSMYKAMPWLKALEDFYEANPGVKDKLPIQREAFSYGFIDGFKAADELSQRKLDAYAAFINGKITRSELDSILGIVTDNV